MGIVVFIFFFEGPSKSCDKTHKLKKRMPLIISDFDFISIYAWHIPVNGYLKCNTSNTATMMRDLGICTHCWFSYSMIRHPKTELILALCKNC